MSIGVTVKLAYKGKYVTTDACHITVVAVQRPSTVYENIVGRFKYPISATAMGERSVRCSKV